MSADVVIAHHTVAPKRNARRFSVCGARFEDALVHISKSRAVPGATREHRLARITT